MRCSNLAALVTTVSLCTSVAAADAPASAITAAAGLHDLGTSARYPGIHAVPSVKVTMNRSQWESLSPKDQAALRSSGNDAMYDAVATVHAKDERLSAEDAAAGKITVIDWARYDCHNQRIVAREQREIFGQKHPLALRASS